MKEIVIAFAIGFGMCFLIFLPKILSKLPEKSGFILNQKDVAIIYAHAYNKGMHTALKCSLSTVEDWDLCINETFRADSINNSNAFNQTK